MKTSTLHRNNLKLIERAKTAINEKIITHQEYSNYLMLANSLDSGPALNIDTELLFKIIDTRDLRRLKSTLKMNQRHRRVFGYVRPNLP